MLRARNGVVIQTSPVTIAMDWVGLQPTYELTFFLRVDRATSVLEFQSIAEQYFKVATQNWAVADSRGNIGIFSYGLFPIISQGIRGYSSWDRSVRLGRIRPHSIST